MASAKRLTEAALRSITYPAQGRDDHFDALVRGLSLRVAASGRKSWSYVYRIDGRQRRLSLGRYPAVPLAEAREAARKAALEVERGNDPAAPAIESRKLTVEVAADQFIEKYRSRQNTAQTVAEATSVFRRHILPTLGQRAIAEVTRRDVIALLDDLACDEHPHRAIKAHKEVRKLFAWALERDLVEANPAMGISLPISTRSRERVLADYEVAAVWHAAIEIGYPMGTLVQLLLLTAQRRGETSRMKWEQLDLKRRLWTIPAETTKSGRLHTVPLSDAMMDIIDDLSRQSGPFVLSTSEGGKPISGFSKGKRRIDAISGVSDWCLHDLRRTAATGMAQLGVAPQVLSRVLNHVPWQTEGVTAIYNRYGYDEEKRAALDAWAKRLADVESSSFVGSA